MYARKCPGCPKIQFVYAKQIHDKQKYMDSHFGPLCGKHGIKVAKVVRSERLSGYRSTAKLALHQDNFGRPSIGIYERGSKDVVDIPECPIHDPSINDIVAKIFRSTTRVPFEFYNHTRKGYQSERLKFVTVRLGYAKAQPGVIVSHTGVDESALAAWIKSRVPRDSSVWACHIKPEDKDLVLTDTLHHLCGPEEIPFAIGDLQLSLHPASFFQANASLSGAFLSHICTSTLASLAERDTLLDLFGGFGAYALSLAPEFKKVITVDGNSSAVSSAVSSAKARGLNHVEGKARSCEVFLRSMKLETKKSVSHLIVNPPRAGLSETVRRAIGRSTFPGLRTVTYVSCNPETLKRDLEGIPFCREGEIKSITPFDMFPQTNHIETVVNVQSR